MHDVWQAWRPALQRASAREPFRFTERILLPSCLPASACRQSRERTAPVLHAVLLEPNYDGDTTALNRTPSSGRRYHKRAQNCSQSRRAKRMAQRVQRPPRFARETGRCNARKLGTKRLTMLGPHDAIDVDLRARSRGAAEFNPIVRTRTANLGRFTWLYGIRRLITLKK